MAEEKNTSRANTWVTFIGVILLLVGIYASARTVINLKAFSKYPQAGVLSFSFGGQAPYYQRESDCSYPQSYYAPDGQVRPPTDAEKKQEQDTVKRCVDAVTDSREQAKVNDISQSLLFLFLGVGVLASRRIFFR